MSSEHRSFIELGEAFHKARSSRKLSIQKISDSTKIKKSYLEAIENGNVSAIPYQTYLIGYIKSYAKLLEFDDKAVVEEYKKALRELVEDDDSIDRYVKACANNAAPEVAKKLPSKKLILLTILVLMFFVYVSYYYNY